MVRLPRSTSVLAIFCVSITCAPGVAGCSGGTASSALLDAPKLEAGKARKCSVGQQPSKLLVLEWPSEDRLALEAQAKRGVVVVKYVGCDMQILRTCRAPGAYGYVATNRQDHEEHITTADELYAKMPIYAARVEGALAKSGHLDAAMSMVGSYQASRASFRADELEGDCNGATHVVTWLTAGAFELVSGAKAEVNGGVAVAGVGTGARSASGRDILNRSGDSTVCGKAAAKDAEPPYGCGSVLEMEVAALVAARTRCEITLPAEACPAHPGPTGSFDDDFEGSASSQPRCLARAAEYYYYCKDTGPVVARFWDGKRLVGERTARPATRCEVTLPPEGCPRDAVVSGTFYDDYESAGSDQERCARRALDWHFHCNVEHPVVTRFFEGARLVREEKADPPTRCEITLSHGCPRNPKLKGNLFNDDYEGSSKSADRCAKRAHEYFDYCGAAGPVTTRFYDHGKVAREERADPKTRCEVQLPGNVCEAHTEISGPFNDAWEGSDHDEARCLKRANEWFGYCGASGPVVVRYHKTAETFSERRLDASTRCQVTLGAGNCPAHADFVANNFFNDDDKGAGSSPTRCLERAAELKAWCNSPAPVRARYYEGSVVKAEITR